MVDVLNKTPLFDQHVAAGGRIVPFAGYHLPVQYQGIIAESKAVREGVGMFDVSHMARLRLTGDRVLEYLEHITTNDVSKLADGTGQYSLLPNPVGGIVDDIIIYRINAGEFRMVVNAANHVKDLAWLKIQNSFGVEIEDLTDESAMIAVQGPKAVETVAGLADFDAGSMNLFQVAFGRVAGVECFAPSSGYTGEDGFELICSVADAPQLWSALLDAGVVPSGLGSRDTLRVEAGLPLYGHELNDDLSPIAAGLGWVISKTKAFIGSEPIQKARAEGTPVKLQGFRLESKRVASPGMEVSSGGEVVGHVSSAVYSPLLDAGIGFAFVEPGLKLGSPISVNIRGKDEPGTLVSKRFFKRGE